MSTRKSRQSIENVSESLFAQLGYSINKKTSEDVICSGEVTLVPKTKSLRSKPLAKKRQRKRICMPKYSKDQSRFLSDNKYTFVSYGNSRDIQMTHSARDLRKVYQIKRSVARTKKTQKTLTVPIAEEDQAAESVARHVPIRNKTKRIKQNVAGSGTGQSRRLSVKFNIDCLSENIDVTQRGALSSDECSSCSVEIDASNSSGLATPITNILCEKCVCALSKRNESLLHKTATLTNMSLFQRTLLGKRKSVNDSHVIHDKKTSNGSESCEKKQTEICRQCSYC